jgi:type I restriction-modification system DNA methylase subunit
MVASGLSVSKQNGVFYTSSTLAKFVVRPLLGNKKCTIFDPAYGNGSLLLAAEAVLREKNGPADRRDFFGCDNSPDNDRIGHFVKANFINIDFFDYRRK